MPRIGVLAIQGDFSEHIDTLERLGADAVPVRLPNDLDSVDALIIPGGESTTISKLMDAFGLREPIRDLAKTKIPIWGTCAGLILMSKKLSGYGPSPLGIIDITASRNYFGRQKDSFVTNLDVPALGYNQFEGVFIRAPGIESLGVGVEVIASLPNGEPVAVKNGNILVTSFHPELTNDYRFHSYFLKFPGINREN